MCDPHRRTMELLPLACLCLVSCSAMTSADGNGPVVITVDEDSVAMLPCSLSTKQNIESKLFDWKKVGEKGEGKKDVFMYDAGSLRDSARSGQHQQFDGRVSHFRDELKHGNASILITKTKVADSGDYTCDFLEPSQSLEPIQTSHIKLLVDPILKPRPTIPGASPLPIVTALGPTEDGVLLQCVVLGASPQPNLHLKDSAGNILPAKEPQVTERGDRYDVILQAMVTKSDYYSCVATQEEINHQIHSLKNYVTVNGAASKPIFEILEQRKDGVLLQCVVKGASPKPELEWQDSSGNIIPAEEPQVTEGGGSYDVILQATVRKTDRYRCVSTQEEINHTTYAENLVTVNESSGESNTGWIVAVVLAALLAVAGVIIAVLVRQKQNSKKVSDPTEEKAGEGVHLNSP